MPLGVISHRRVRLRLRTASWTPASFVREVVWCLHLRVGAAHSHGLRRGGVVSCVFSSRRHIILSFPAFICCLRSHCSSRCLASCRFVALSCILKDSFSHLTETRRILKVCCISRQSHVSGPLFFVGDELTEGATRNENLLFGTLRGRL